MQGVKKYVRNTKLTIKPIQRDVNTTKVFQVMSEGETIIFKKKIHQDSFLRENGEQSQEKISTYHQVLPEQKQRRSFGPLKAEFKRDGSHTSGREGNQEKK